MGDQPDWIRGQSSRLAMMFRLMLAAAALGALGSSASAQSPGYQGAFGPIKNSFTWLVRTQFQPQGDVISATFGSALQRSRDEARADSKPMPEKIRKALSPFYDDKLMASVRYKVGDTSQGGLAGFAIRNGNAAAVTLVDTVVFKEDRHTDDLELWAHEMHHVEQFRDWGVNGFASRYAFGWQHVEAEAEAKAAEFVSWYKARREAAK